MMRWVACACVLLSLLLQVKSSSALPSQRCETIEIVDHEGMSRQLGLPQLVELLKTIPLTIVPNGVPADVRLDLTFSPASSAIHATITAWAETESIELQSGRVRALEDFQARRRTLQPMQEADAEAFRRQIVEELKKQIDARTAAVVIASEPDGLPVVTTVPERAAPLNRNRSVAVLGCLREGAQLEGYVAWPDGRREPFKQRASRTPARFIVGTRASTARPPSPAGPPPTDASATEPEPPPSPAKQASVSTYWWLGAPLALILALTARAVIKNR
jgi:hypothetical protein